MTGFMKTLLKLMGMFLEIGEILHMNMTMSY